INNPENRRGNVSIVGYPVMTYHDPAANIDINCTDIEVAFPVDGRISVGHGFEVKTIPEHKVVSVIHTGPYSGCEGAYTEAMNFIARKGLTVAGPFREIYMNSPEDVPESQLLTEIQVPIE
ncbi:MAG TPA: GyrI-like domain-containing protein, partial [Ignavibacteriales bacterium]|nr:GyrI-like domain-containing protein [Ignavibacteriales bacterium]